MRLFIAIELSQEIKDFLSSLQEKLKAAKADVKWVQPQNIHLTLKFLGEVGEKKLDKVIQFLGDAVKDSCSFTLRICSLGAFPKINYPRVIWVGIDKGEDETKTLAAAIENNMAEIGIPSESRPFSSHITIGRLRSNLNRERLVKELSQMQEKPPEEAAELNVSKITLFKSTLTPNGPVYEPLKEYCLILN